MPATDFRAHPACTRTGATYYGLLLYQVSLQPAKDMLNGNQGCGLSARDEGFHSSGPRTAGLVPAGQPESKLGPIPGLTHARPKVSAGDKPVHAA